MTRLILKGKLLIGSWIMLAMTWAYAGMPLWSFVPLTETSILIQANNTATVNYQVTNQSKKTHTLGLSAIPAITQITSAGNCPNPFVLAYQQSCTLGLIIHGSTLQGDVIGGPLVCQQGSTLQCYQPSSVKLGLQN